MATVYDMATEMIETSLVEAFRDIGYAFTASVEDCKSHMSNFGLGEPTTSDIARILTVMMNYHNTDIKKNPISHQDYDHWNLEVFVQTLKKLAPKLNWKEVILQLDHPEFYCSDRKALKILINSLNLGLQKGSYPPETFPGVYFCARWKNLEGQMSLITHILKNSNVFSFGDHLYLVSIDLLISPPDVDNKDISMWRSFYLVDFLLYAADHGYYLQAHDLFKFPLQHCPDILALVLLQINSPMTVLRQELLTLLVVTFLGNHPNSTVILHLTWDSHYSTTKSIMMHAMAEWYLRGEHDQTKLSRILDIAQDLKDLLSLLLNVSAFPFVIDLACLASRRDYLKLDKWLTDKIRDHGETFITALVKFLQRRCPGVVGKVSEEQWLKTTKLPRETVFTMMSCLQPCITNVQPELQEAIYNVITSYQTFLSNKRPLCGLARPHSRSLDASSNTAFAMPSTLGSLVNPASPSRSMVHKSNINLSALARMPPAPLISKLTHKLTHSVAKEIGLPSQQPPTRPQEPVLPAILANSLNQKTHTVSPFRSVTPCLPVTKVSNTAGALGSLPSIAIATSIDTLLTATDKVGKSNAPPEKIQDKIAIIINNLSQLNLQIKCSELKTIITEEHYQWLSQYLVMKRASIELHFHALYLNFLEVLKNQVIDKMVLSETFRNIKILLGSDKGIANFSDRSLLKNLGHWLGMLTLARNLPILHLDIDLRGLILEAYYKGPLELLYVVPFVTKILQSCAKSNVFKPPNPWTMALMNVLAELNLEPNLKLNLKYEIEVLCKNLSLDIVLLKPTSYLKDPENLKHIEFHLSQPKPNLETASASH